MNYTIEEIKSQHDMTVCDIIKKVGREYGAIGEGFGPSDSEVKTMSQHYKNENASRYLVASIEGDIVGGSGIAAFNNSNEICELRKLFLLPESRGLGIGKKLTEECLEYAKSKGYKHCYLDTLTSMKSAIALYKKLGFQFLDKPLPGTIHNGCDVWMLKEL
ncbi:GNAT family N-acetyltransferase [Psychromonas ingrahamii]|uniref:GNAT family N-acetyltransferase n=1 Tax=Psychromonas ingrahamii TaxID=357794 RepID=UPI0000D8027F|nr:GNAT family N-acetyltransferase [Psychromonas ingrahamii]